MSSRERPISITILAFLYAAIGCIGFVYHFHALLQPGGVWIELTESLAILCGVFLFRGKNWARWLALAWIAFHVILSAFGGFDGRLAIHALFFVIIAWLLFRPAARRYFRGAEMSR